MTQIILGPSTPAFGSGQYQFINIGGNNIEVVTTNTIFGLMTAQYGGDIGSYTLEPTAFTAGPLNGGVYPTSGTENFEVNFAVSGKLHGTITWNQLSDPGPQLDGDFLTTLSTGSVAADFPVGSHAAIDVTSSPLGIPLANIVEWGYGDIMNGHLIPHDIPATEPGVFVLMALAIVWAFLLRKLT